MHQISDDCFTVCYPVDCKHFHCTAVRGQVVHHTESIVKIKFQLMEALCRIVRELVMYSTSIQCLCKSMPTNATLYLLQSCRLHNVDKYVQFRRTDVVGAQSFCPRGSHVAHDHTSDDHTSDDHTSDDRTSDDHTSDDHSSDDHASHDHASYDHTSDDHTSDDHTSDDHASHDRVLFRCTQL